MADFAIKNGPLGLPCGPSLGAKCLKKGNGNGPFDERTGHDMPGLFQYVPWAAYKSVQNACGAHASRESADAAAVNRLACVRMVIDCEEGEGL